MGEYISIKAFAERAGVSTQAIYQRLAKDLQSYCKEVKGKKMLDTAALALFDIEPLQSDCKEFTNDLQSAGNDLQSALTETITALREQLAIKDKQIEALTTALMNAQHAEQQAHALHAGTMQAAALIETRTETGTAPAVEDKKRGWRFWRR